MIRISHLRSVPLIFLLGLLGASTSGCADEEELGVVFPSSPGAAVASGLARGCRGADPTMGRLSGAVYSLPLETRQLPDFAALRSVGTICMNGLDVTERRGYPGFPGVHNRFEWFGVDFQGAFEVAQPGRFHFRLTSDDGSKLYIDGKLVIDNDGYHATRSIEGDVDLGAGPHVIAVPYWQGPGPLSLVLEVARPGEGYDVFRADRPL
jgi:PA14 domain